VVRRVVLEGCNGDWAQKHYLPFLIEKAAKGEMELWAVDIVDSIKLGNSQVKKEWKNAQSNNWAYYLNKNIHHYNELSNANHVFAVTPDRSHCQIAELWLDRLALEGKIFIEKPLDAFVASAYKLKEKIGEKGKETVFAFDHYFASAYPFLRNKALYLGEIGEIRKIEFHILEPFPIPQHRVETLDKGMIFDLFCHVLALVYTVVNRDLTSSATELPAIKLEEVKAAQYSGCPISGETFTWIKFIVNSGIEVISVTGKCVGTSKDKFMRLYGSNGSIKLDFVEDEFSIFDSQGRQQKQGRLNSKHVESFLESVLPGKEHPLSAPGVISFDAALEILKILDKAKTQIGNKLPKYQCKDSIDKILGILGEGKLY